MWTAKWYLTEIVGEPRSDWVIILEQRNKSKLTESAARILHDQGVAWCKWIWRIAGWEKGYLEEWIELGQTLRPMIAQVSRVRRSTMLVTDAGPTQPLEGLDCVREQSSSTTRADSTHD